ncbi:MAG: thioredoxin family protein [Bdellovibrionales bacterium]|nr:thioredoxin family protein [Bdellovibrionales bacterium]
MALTYTPSGELQSSCPHFSLLGVDGHQYSLDSFCDAQALVVLFICNHCPYVQAIEERIIQLAADLKKMNVQVIGICSNDPSEYEEDSYENLKKRWLEKKYEFPYLFDESQEVAKNFGAVCTPDLFVYDDNRNLIYRGRLDDSWRDASKVKEESLKEAVINYLNGCPVASDQVPSMGCSIKWKSES